MPNVAHELVRRAVGRGDLSIKSLKRDNLSGHKQVDMTAGMVVAGAGLVIARVVTRGSGDHDMTLMLGGSSVAFMLLRFMAGRLGRKTANTR